MDEQSRAAQRAYQNAWRAANKGKVKEYNRRYWARKAKQLETEQPEKKACIPSPDELAKEATCGE